MMMNRYFLIFKVKRMNTSLVGGSNFPSYELALAGAEEVLRAHMAWYPDRFWHVTKLGPGRYALDLGRLRIRWEVYR